MLIGLKEQDPLMEFFIQVDLMQLYTIMIVNLLKKEELCQDGILSLKKMYSNMAMLAQLVTFFQFISK